MLAGGQKRKSVMISSPYTQDSTGRPTLQNLLRIREIAFLNFKDQHCKKSSLLSKKDFYLFPWDHPPAAAMVPSKNL